MSATNVTTEIPLEGGEILGVRIGRDPHRPGLDRVRLLDFGRPLWAIIANLQGTDWDIEQTARDYDIPVEAVRATKLYYDAHPEYIDAFLLINRSAFTR